MTYTLQSILQLYQDRGHAQYGGEAVSQLAHALQCAALAETAKARDTLIAAAFLHDLGHLVHPLGESAASRSMDDRHEYRAMPLLKHLFPLAVTGPIRLHVDAKRYLCAIEKPYWASLSPVSKRTLELQGGIFSPLEAEAFIQQPYADEAVCLRRWDDAAKIAHQPTPPLEHFVAVLERVEIAP